jgi:hypothetical protein
MRQKCCVRYRKYIAMTRPGKGPELARPNSVLYRKIILHIECNLAIAAAVLLWPLIAVEGDGTTTRVALPRLSSPGSTPASAALNIINRAIARLVGGEPQEGKVCIYLDGVENGFHL